MLDNQNRAYGITITPEAVTVIYGGKKIPGVKAIDVNTRLGEVATVTIETHAHFEEVSAFLEFGEYTLKRWADELGYAMVRRFVA